MCVCKHYDYFVANKKVSLLRDCLPLVTRTNDLTINKAHVADLAHATLVLAHSIDNYSVGEINVVTRTRITPDNVPTNLREKSNAESAADDKETLDTPARFATTDTEGMRLRTLHRLSGILSPALHALNPSDSPTVGETITVPKTHELLLDMEPVTTADLCKDKTISPGLPCDHICHG